MPKLRKPKSSAETPAILSLHKFRDASGQQMSEPVQEIMAGALDRAEAAINQRFLDGWLRALNDPEGYRLKGATIGEAFAMIRGELTNG